MYMQIQLAVTSGLANGAVQGRFPPSAKITVGKNGLNNQMIFHVELGPE